MWKKQSKTGGGVNQLEVKKTWRCEMILAFVVATVVAVGAVVIYRSLVQAGEDPEIFDADSFGERIQKPEGWKIGQLPESMHKNQLETKKKLAPTNY